MPDDLDFREALRTRIVRYSELEAKVAERVAELEVELDDLRRRRQSAEELHKAEFGDDPAIYQPAAGAEPVRAAESPATYVAVSMGPLFAMTWSEAITSVLADAADPLHVTDIWRRMRDGGFTTTTQDPLRSIVSIAVRTPEIVRAGPNTYSLAGGDA